MLFTRIVLGCIVGALIGYFISGMIVISEGLPLMIPEITKGIGFFIKHFKEIISKHWRGIIKILVVFSPLIYVVYVGFSENPLLMIILLVAFSGGLCGVKR